MRPAPTLTMDSLRRNRTDYGGFLFHAALLIALSLCLLLLGTLLAQVFAGGIGLLRERPGDFLTSPLSSLPERAGVIQGIVGSLLLTAIVVVIAIPVGVAAAVYLEEYARDTRLNRILYVNVRNLAGVPSVVYGLLGLAILVRSLGAITGGSSLISGGLTLAMLVLPIVIITTAEALRSVPRSIREAAYGVGATQWQVIRSHVLPAAAPGVMTGTVLSLARALGETAPLILVGAVTGFFATGGQSLVEQLQGRFTSLPTIIFAWSRQPSTDFRELTSAAIIVLLVVILLANGAAVLLRNRYERKW